MSLTSTAHAALADYFADQSEELASLLDPQSPPAERLASARLALQLTFADGHLELLPVGEERERVSGGIATLLLEPRSTRPTAPTAAEAGQ